MSFISLFVTSISKPSLNVKYFKNISIPLLTKYFVACLVNSGALFINYRVLALLDIYGKAASDSRRI